MPSFKPIICVDFDGVIHSYERGWQNGEIYGEVVPGFFEWVERVRDHVQVVVYSSPTSTSRHIASCISDPSGPSIIRFTTSKTTARSKTEDGMIAMGMWLHKKRNEWIASGGQRHPTEPLEIQCVHEKPKAWLTIDDRAICFRGDWTATELSLDSMLAFKPWNAKEKL